MANLLNRARDNFFGNNNNNNNNQHIHDEGVVMPEIDHETDDDDVDDPLALSAPKRSLNATMSDHALNTLNELRRNNLLCDAVVSVSDASFNVHRAIMSACSSYFRWV